MMFPYVHFSFLVVLLCAKIFGLLAKLPERGDDCELFFAAGNLEDCLKPYIAPSPSFMLLDACTYLK